MKNKEFKLLIKGFNNFLMSESDSKSDEDTQKLFDAITFHAPIFEKYVNSDIGWINGSAWLKEFPGHKAHFEKLVKEFKREVEDFLVIDVDEFSDSLEFDGL